MHAIAKTLLVVKFSWMETVFVVAAGAAEMRVRIVFDESGEISHIYSHY